MSPPVRWSRSSGALLRNFSHDTLARRLPGQDKAQVATSRRRRDRGEAPSMADERTSLRALLLYFLRLGTLGFGGPIALAAHMEQDLVEQRGWINAQEYKEGLAFAQLAPGPLAAQLAIYLGWVRGRVLGATLAGIAFVAPSFLMVLVLSELYVRFGGLPWMQGLFYGIGAAVIAIIARSALKLVRMTLGRDHLLWILFAVSAVVTAWTESEIIWVFLVCGLVPMLLRGRRTTPATAALALLPVAPGLASGLGGPASVGVLWKILTYFAGASLFVFGSGLAIVPFLYGGVVRQFHWLTERQFIDAVAVSMITPAPVVITVAFIGYLVGGLAGAILAAIGVFLPVYLITLLSAPLFHLVAKNRQREAFVDGVTAGATGAIAGAAVILGRRALLDGPTILTALVTLALLLVPKKIPEPVLILAAGIVGLVNQHWFRDLLVTLALLLVPKKIPEPVLILAAGIVGLVLKGMW